MPNNHYNKKLAQERTAGLHGVEGIRLALREVEDDNEINRLLQESTVKLLRAHRAGFMADVDKCIVMMSLIGEEQQRRLGLKKGDGG